MGANVELMVEVGHTSSIAGAKWCRPIGWTPKNAIEGAEWNDVDGVWWGDDGEAAGIVVFGGHDTTGDKVTVGLDDLRVASCGECRVIADVEADFA